MDMKDKIIIFLTTGLVILGFLLVCMFYSNKSLKVEKNALYTDVERYKQSLIEMEKQNEVLIKAKKENEQFRKDLSDDNSDNLNVVPADYILNRLHTD